jgi:hypothetical protein
LKIVMNRSKKMTKRRVKVTPLIVKQILMILKPIWNMINSLLDQEASHLNLKINLIMRAGVQAKINQYNNKKVLSKSFRGNVRPGCQCAKRTREKY